MSKLIDAEKRALELFPVDMQMCIDSTGEPYEVDVNAQRRKYVAFGYEQAEKDLALTWEDVKKIEDLCMEVATLFASVGRNKVILEQPFYEEIARRFNEQRKK